MIQNKANVWNYASLGNSSKRANKAETQSSKPNLSIDELEAKDGQVTITDLGAPTPPRVIQDVKAKVSPVSLTTPFTYSLSAAFPGNGTISVSGKGGPFNQADASKTPFTAKIEVNVRIITSTTRNLEAEIAAGRFREDLYHRLSVVPIRVPPLTERREDVAELVAHFMD